MRYHMSAFVTTLTLVCVSLAGVQTKPNLNGTWKMNQQKSKFSPNSGPEAMTIKFDHKDINLTENLTIGLGGAERTFEIKYTTDGKDSVNQIGSASVKTSANWEGDALVIEWKGEGRSFRRKFTLSGDGKMITVAVHHVDPNGEKDETIVLEKQ